MKIYVIRHGETNDNKRAVFQGSNDIPLNEKGIDLAKITGEAIKGVKFDVCYSSTLDRAKKTAELVLKHSGNEKTPIIYDERLKELDCGDWEGRSARKEDKEVPSLQLKLFKKNLLFAGRPRNGENVFELMKRTQQVLKEISEKDYKTVLVSTHGAALRAMLHRLYKNKLDYWQGHVPYNCSISIVEVKNGKMKLLESDKIFYDKKLVDNLF